VAAVPVTGIERYHRPTTLDDAWRLVRDGGGAVRLLAGGTDLVVGCPPEVRVLVDLQAADLGAITVAGDGTMRIGATATFTEMLEHDVLGAHAGGVLAETLVQFGSLLHRNSATIGGHVARGRMSDLIPVLVALDAVAERYDGAVHQAPITEHLAGPRSPHVVTAVVLPPLPGSQAAFVRFSRSAFDHALVNACCRVELDRRDVTVARVVVGETATLGHRVAVAEDALTGRPLDAATIAEVADLVRGAVDLHGDWVASADYRRHLAGVAVIRCLETLARRTEAGGP
jgi:CO/xanthine dehydrogenase FAD-binding subunit